MTIIPKAIYRFNAIPIKLPKAFFTEPEQKILNLYGNTKDPKWLKTILRKKSRAGGSRVPDFGLLYKATVIKTVWYWHKNRHINPWKRMGIPEINPHTYGQLIYAKVDKNIQGEKTSSSKVLSGKQDSYMQKSQTRIFSLTKYKNKIKID